MLEQTLSGWPEDTSVAERLPSESRASSKKPDSLIVRGAAALALWLCICVIGLIDLKYPDPAEKADEPRPAT